MTLLVTLAVCLTALAATSRAPRKLTAPQVRELPRPNSVWFEPNRGQVAGRTQWVARAPGAFLYITGPEVVFAMPPENGRPATGCATCT
ncbi:MAG: hypothetical protein HYS04_21015 [Acidobacteria bacterium]|nr:hypothetical protein [Acidobacteriota bacterium]